uniref:WAPL domain-containing protein n=1 Tax=Neolamprologus brichardi TaxID=32507 RepID=A0A3Q4I587_NEOBR
MTSRFGKTYSRKGGEGTSKFDEVLSTKRGTLSTKWGDTTYKAKVGSKRAGAPKNDSVLEVYKRPRTCGDGLDDPFGFDSDEESKPVSSRSGSKSSPANCCYVLVVLLLGQCTAPDRGSVMVVHYCGSCSAVSTCS